MIAIGLDTDKNDENTIDNTALNQSKIPSPIQKMTPFYKLNNNTLSSLVDTVPTDSSNPANIKQHTYEGKRRLSFIRMFCLFSVSFSYSMAFSSINSIVIPKEIGRLTTKRQSIWVGLLMAFGAISQLATPIVGALSDRRGPASRTQFLIYGAVVTVLGISGFSIVASFSSLLMLLGALIITTIGLSVQYSMMTAMLTDHIVEEQMGLASGMMAVQGMMGSGMGYLLFALNLDLHVSYTAYIISTITCTLLTCLFTPAVRASNTGRCSRVSGTDDDDELMSDNNTSNNPSQAAMRGKRGVSGIGGHGVVPSAHRHKKSSDYNILTTSSGGAYNYIPLQVSTCVGYIYNGKCNKGAKTDIRKKAKRLKRFAANTLNKATNEVAIPCCQLLVESLVLPKHSESPDFFYACLGRSLFNVGLGGQLFLVYYLRDVMKAENPLQLTSVIAMMALFGGLLGALPLGKLSDILGKKPLIYMSIGLCVSSLVLFMIVSDLQMMQVVGFIYGIGNVGYLSVEYALGVQSLPKRLVTEKSMWRCRSQQLCDNNSGAPSPRVHLSEENNNHNSDDICSFTDGNNNDIKGENPHRVTQVYTLANDEHKTDDGIPQSIVKNDSIISAATDDTLLSHDPVNSHLVSNDVTNNAAKVSITDGVVGMVHGENGRQVKEGYSQIAQYNNNLHHNSYCHHSEEMIDCYCTYCTTTTSYKPSDAARDLGVFAMSATFGQMIGQIIYGTLLNYYGTSIIYQVGSGDIIGANTASSRGINGLTGPGTIGVMGHNAVPHSVIPITVNGTDIKFVEISVYTQTGFIIIYSIASLAFVLSGLSTYYVGGVR